MDKLQEIKDNYAVVCGEESESRFEALILDFLNYDVPWLIAEVERLRVELDPLPTFFRGQCVCGHLHRTHFMVDPSDRCAAGCPCDNFVQGEPIE